MSIARSIIKWHESKLMHYAQFNGRIESILFAAKEDNEVTKAEMIARIERALELLDSDLKYES